MVIASETVGQQPVGGPTTTTPVNDVVFVVEATAALGGYFDSIRTSYILPTLEYFNGGPPDEIDYGCDYSCTMYSLVLYKSGDCSPEPAAYCFQPTTSTYQFLQYLDKIQFYGGAGEEYSLMAEGLSTCLQVFDDLKKKRGNNVITQKHCILVCNSPAYQLPSQESFNYAGLLPDQLVLKLSEKEVNFSVFAPRKMTAVMKLFDKANKEILSPQMRNFTQDSRHLVLLKGFALQERPLSPTSIMKTEDVEMKPSTGSSSTTGGSSSVAKQPSPASAQASGMTRPNNPTSIGMPRGNNPGVLLQQQQQQQQTNAAAEEAKKILQQANVTAAMSTGVGQVRPNQPGQPGMPGQPNQSMGIPAQNQGFPGQMQRPQMPQGMGMSTMGGQMNQQAPGLMTSQQQPMSQANQGFQTGAPNMNPNVAMMQQGQQMQPGMDANQGGMNVLGVDINNPQGALENAALQQQQAAQQKRIIWTGALEWNEKSKSDQPSATMAMNQKITRSLACNVSITPPDEVNASKWPNKLIMQLIPQQLLQPLSSLFRNSRKVLFNFSNTDIESLKSLYKVMATGFAGYIHFPIIAQTEVRLLMLLYSSKQRQFMGLIPNEQARFVQGIKTIINKHKQLQVFKQQGGLVTSSTGVMPGAQQPMTSQVGAGMSGMPGNTMPNMVNTQPGAMMSSQQGVPFDMGGNMAPGGAGGMQQQQMINPQQQQAFRQQQLLARQQQQQQLQQQRLQQLQQQQQQMGHPANQQQLKHLLMNQQQQQQIRQQQMMMQQRGPRPSQAGMMGAQPGMGVAPGMPQQNSQPPFMPGENFDLPDLGI